MGRKPELPFAAPKIPVLFPRHEWADTEWWGRETKWQRAAGLAHRASTRWYSHIYENYRDMSIDAVQFKLAVYDRVDQINHQLRRLRQYAGVHETVAAWQQEMDNVVKMVFDEALAALPPDGAHTIPPLDEVCSFSRAVMEHQYIQGKDAQPAFTPTSDWDEEPLLKRYPIFRSAADAIRVWPGMGAATAQLEEDRRRGAGDYSWMHPSRPAHPEQWRPWKYKLDDQYRGQALWEVIAWKAPSAEDDDDD